MALNKQQQEVVDTINGPIMVLSVAGSGKALVNGTNVMTPNGYTPIENLKYGDKIFGRDGKVYSVSGVFPQGKKQVYKIKFSDGSVIKCCEDHLWNYQTRKDKKNNSEKWYTNNTKYILENEELRLNGKWNIYIPICEPLKFDQKILPIKPYSMGILLGSYKLCNKNIKIPKRYKDILETIIIDLEVINNFNKNTKQILKNLNLTKTGSNNKFIPEEYKFSNVSDRIQLIQGLIDINGSYKKDHYEYKTSSKQLALDIKFICESLGAVVRLNVKNTQCINKFVYKLSIKPSKNLPIFHCSNRVGRQWIQSKSYACRTIKKIEKTQDYESMTCIKTNAPDELFIIDNCIVTHNTTTVIKRMANLIEHDINPGNILGLTFSKKAADELKERVNKIIGQKGLYITTKTFHAFALKLLKTDGDKIGLNPNFSVLKYDREKTTLVRECLEDLGLDKVYKGKNDARDIRKFIDLVKINLIKTGDFLSSSFSVLPFSRRDFNKVYIKYQEKLRNKNQLDFGDIISQAIKLLENDEIREKYQNIYKYIFVDEYQDTNKGQYMIMKLLAERDHNICVVGDLDQRIYDFQGANKEAAESFIKDFPEYKMIKMEQNYRSTPSIINVANDLISNNINRISTNIWTENKESNPVLVVEHENDDEQAKYVIDDIIDTMKKNPSLKYSDFAILYRINLMSSNFGNELKRKKIPFIMGSSENYFYNQEVVKDLMSYLRLLNDLDNREATINNLSLQPGIGKQTIMKMVECAENNNISILQAIRGNVEQNLKYMCKNIGGQLNSLSKFLLGIDYLINFNNTHTLDELINEIVEYSTFTTDMLKGGEFNQERYQNVLELQKEILVYVEKQKSKGEPYTLGDFIKEVDSIMLEDDEANIDGVILSTVHGVKGREFEYVYIVNFDDRSFPYYLSHANQENIEEERRLAYVAITRAKYQVAINYCKKSYNPYKKVFLPTLPSRFLSEVAGKNTRFI